MKFNFNTQSYTAMWIFHIFQTGSLFLRLLSSEYTKFD